MEFKLIATTIIDTRLTETEKDTVDRFFLEKKLNEDYVNAFAIFFYYVELKELDKVQPIELYANYFLKRYHNEYSYVMKKSDPTALDKLNACVSKYNFDLEKMKINQDFERILKRLNQILCLTRTSARRPVS